ncbi:mitotic checkpoint regulator, MAD2B-interacting-domain-containing protein [Biscogniauxia marginata]|nr:mitotic checkpoint regulator, MAD2B-interacting-domain-containing protein [Biscogniauxia marginata]
MGLVDYSDSESETEAVTKPTPKPSATAPSTTGSKKPFQKVVDRARPGKILVNLPQGSGRDDSGSTNNDADGPPAKRAKISGRGGGAFSGFNSLLPPPKNAGKPATISSSGGGGGKSAPKPGINLKTGATPGFSREANGGDGDQTGADGDAAPKTQQPSIPAEQKAAEDVKLVGKPLMFKPLSVSRRPAKKNAVKSTTRTAPTPPTSEAPDTTQATKATGAVKQEEPPPPQKKKVSLFSIPADEEPEHTPHSRSSDINGVYEPLFSAADDNTNASAFAAYDAQYAPSTSTTPPSTSLDPNANSLDAIAAEMNLSASARRELFGRSSSVAATSSAPPPPVISFDTSREYEHNAALLREGGANGQQPFSHNPLRAIAPGKHSLRQLVNQVHNQRDALEESFAKGRSTQREAGARYGWR